MRKRCGGFIVEVVNDVHVGKTLVYPLYAVGKSTAVMGPDGKWFHMALEKNTAYWVMDTFLHPVDSQFRDFELGDIVRACQEGNRGFIGEVVAFELDGGVVCRSTNQKTSDRCRFTYAPKDLLLVQKHEYKAKQKIDGPVTILTEDGDGQLCMIVIK